MYTFNYFCFGHKMSVNKQLNNKLREFDISFDKQINGREWELSFPYHGGQISGDCYSCVLGTIISHDDNNLNYLNEIRNAKESDYIDDYNKFISDLIASLEKESDIFDDENFTKLVIEFKLFLQENKPEFYNVEASS